MKKRSVNISGHATSITLETEFWGLLKAIAARDKKSINALISEIDENRAGNNLSSAIRLYVLKDVMKEKNKQT